MIRRKRYFLCPRCGGKLSKERDRYLRKEYKFVCKHCDENFYGFEAVKAVISVK